MRCSSWERPDFPARRGAASGWSSWKPLGGVLTSQPSAIGLGPGPFGPLAVFVRGTDGKVWYRTLGTGGWSGWALLGGQLLSGTGPATGGFGILLLAVAGTDRHAWMFSQTDGTRYGFVDFGGLTIASPAPAAITIPVFAVFARGTDNALWYRQGHLPLAPGGPWVSLGGRLTSGVTAASEDRGKTYVFALGTDNHIWMRSGVFPGSFPGNVARAASRIRHDRVTAALASHDSRPKSILKSPRSHCLPVASSMAHAAGLLPACSSLSPTSSHFTRPVRGGRRIYRAALVMSLLAR